MLILARPVSPDEIMSTPATKVLFQQRFSQFQKNVPFFSCSYDKSFSDSGTERRPLRKGSSRETDLLGC